MDSPVDAAHYLTVGDIQAHLGLLKAFHDLRTRVGDADWRPFVSNAVAGFRLWAKGDRQSSKALETPSLDILMVWHTYLLNPLKYERDTTSAYPRLREWEFPLQSAASSSVRANEQRRPATTEDGRDAISLKDLESAVHRQASFVAKMASLGWTTSEGSEELAARCLRRYTHFLQLMATTKHVSLVPTLDIDLAWHTHQLQGLKYCQHTKDLLGHVLDHDDNIPDTKLSQGFESTSVRWQKEFGSPYLIAGTKLSAGCGSGGCDGSCGGREVGEWNATGIAGCGSGCNGECGSCGAKVVGCGSGGCNGECGSCGSALLAATPELVADA